MKKGIFSVFIFLGLAILAPLSVSADHSMQEGEMHTVSEGVCAIVSTLTVGSRGEEVLCLQGHLIKDGLLAISPATGYFGEMTKAAVTKWQESKGVPATGVFGTLSRTAFAGRTAEQVVEAPQMQMQKSIDVAAWPSVPTVEIVAHPDAMVGWNLEIKTTNFRFAPEHASGAVLPNEGHAHLMVDGKKLARVYGNWFHIPKEAALTSGSHEVHVTLNANDHSDLVAAGVTIGAKATITVP
jgi:peptidoglycan hydrolase-like protein with peptidoglycan-binding domain